MAYPIPHKPKSTALPEAAATQSEDDSGGGYFEGAEGVYITGATYEVVAGHKFRIANGGPIHEAPKPEGKMKSHFKNAKNVHIGHGAVFSSVGGNMYTDAPDPMSPPPGFSYQWYHGTHQGTSGTPTPNAHSQDWRNAPNYNPEMQGQHSYWPANGPMNPAGPMPAPPMYPYGPYPPVGRNYIFAYPGGPPMPTPMTMPQQGGSYQGHNVDSNMPFNAQHTPSQHSGDTIRENVQSNRREIVSPPQNQASSSAKDGETSSVASTLDDGEPKSQQAESSSKKSLWSKLKPTGKDKGKGKS
ncbi:hypothetical protein BDN70DRAFT_921100, partial [Pholiota conissans]